MSRITTIIPPARYSGKTDTLVVVSLMGYFFLCTAAKSKLAWTENLGKFETEDEAYALGRKLNGYAR
jgi:hypothetical protein